MTRINATLDSTRNRSMRSTSRARELIARRVGDIALALGVIILMLPLVFTVLIAFRTASDVAQNPLGWPSSLTISNFAHVVGLLDFWNSLRTTLILVVASCALTIIVGAMASYPIARITRRWSVVVYRFFIVGLTVPIFVLLGPLYVFVRNLGLINNWAGVILIYTAEYVPLAVFFFTSFLRQIPVELEEAAAIDGAGPIRTFFRVIFPLLRPITATLATFVALAIWNDFLIPYVFLQDESDRTLVANAYSLYDMKELQPTVLFPAALLSMAPLVIGFIFLQRHLVAGLTVGAVKG